MLEILKSKIHRATVTDANVDYAGSITIDSELLEHADMMVYEKVLVVSIDSGERLETYIIEGERGAGEIVLNGAAAKKIFKGDKIIIMSFMNIEKEEAKKHRPKIVLVDSNNKILREEDHLEPDDQC